VRRPLLLLAVVIGLVAVSLVAIALRPAVLGLDLQGGVEVILQGEATEDAKVTPEAISRSVEIIRNRVDSFGVAEPEIQTQGSDQIVVALPGADNPEQVVNDLIQPAQLVFINFEANVVDQAGTPKLSDAIALAKRTPPKGTRPGARATFYAMDKDGNYLFGPAPDRQSLAENFPGNTIPAGVKVGEVPKGLFLAYEERGLSTRSGSGPAQRIWYVFQNNPGLLGRDISKARSEISNPGIGGGQQIVTIKFTGEGRQKFADITRELAVDGNLAGTPQRFAIILDGKIVSNPTVDYKTYPTGIDGRNGAQIEGNFSRGEADTLAKQINSGALPINLKVISQKQVSATLGKQSLRQGLIAGLAGLLFVMIFLIAYYRFLGVIAAGALIVYAILLYAVAVLVPITLTLPGIAGIILTIGVASDANVVIFERVREEARSGKSPRAAILSGYKKGISAIIDANVVTLATAAILFLFATAGVKGFAFTLFIGVLLSLFTAVVATRAAFNVLAETRFLRDDRYLGLKQREIKWKFDWVGHWKLWMAISFVPLALGAVYIGINGLNLGLDFESGTRAEMRFERPATEDGVRSVLQDLNIQGTKVQASKEQVDGREVDGFQVTTETLQPPQVQALRTALDQKYGLVNNEFVSLDTVGPVFGEQIIRNAIYAILLSFAVIILYLSVRFEYKLALPALLSVIHDVWLSIAIYSITGREVTSATVAALLTILGYSLYDVVIVFDRIRENVPIMRRSTYREVVNTSIHEVLTRTIITQITTLIPIGALYFFGGDTLKDFAFALMVGILSGGISSIAIAAPIAALWKEHEPEQKRRTTKAERRALQAQALTADSDVADLEVLARAEAALANEIRLEEGGALDDEVREDEARLQIESGEEPEAEAEAEAEPEAEPDEEPEPEPDADHDADHEADGGVAAEQPAPVPSADGGAEPSEQPPAERTPRARPDSGRVRRHRQVQKKRRR
jgi:SecD/SecF fusion protein